MHTRGVIPKSTKPTYVYCCGKEVYAVPAGKDLVPMYRRNGITKELVRCPLCEREIILRLADEVV